MNSEVYKDSVFYSPADVSAGCIRRTYHHLAFAVLAFIAMETLLLQWSGAERLVYLMVDGYSWLFVLGAFMGVSGLADHWARSDTSSQLQYLGLGLYVVAEAVIFLPLLYIAANFSSPDVIPIAGIITALLFGGLTFTAFTTRTDFSFLRSILAIGGFLALGVIVASILFGFSLGILLSTLMMAFAGGAILYNTSNVIREYRPDQHVAASLALFASVALLFWYVLQVVMSFAGDD